MFWYARTVLVCPNCSGVPNTLASDGAISGQLHIAENRMVKILMNDARRYWSVLSMSYLSEISVRRNREASLHGPRRNIVRARPRASSYHWGRSIVCCCECSLSGKQNIHTEHCHFYSSKRSLKHTSQERVVNSRFGQDGASRTIGHSEFEWVFFRCSLSRYSRSVHNKLFTVLFPEIRRTTSPSKNLQHAIKTSKIEEIRRRSS